MHFCLTYIHTHSAKISGILVIQQFCPFLALERFWCLCSKEEEKLRDAGNATIPADNLPLSPNHCAHRPAHWSHSILQQKRSTCSASGSVFTALTDAHKPPHVKLCHTKETQRKKMQRLSGGQLLRSRMFLYCQKTDVFDSSSKWGRSLTFRGLHSTPPAGSFETRKSGITVGKNVRPERGRESVPRGK